MSDLISREQALDALDRFSLGETDVVKLTFRLREYLMWLPSAEAAVNREGKWIHRGCGVFSCDQCGKDVGTNVYTREEASERFKFCPECGADMRGEQK